MPRGYQNESFVVIELVTRESVAFFDHIQSSCGRAQLNQTQHDLKLCFDVRKLLISV